MRIRVLVRTVKTEGDRVLYASARNLSPTKAVRSVSAALRAGHLVHVRVRFR